MFKRSVSNVMWLTLLSNVIISFLVVPLVNAQQIENEITVIDNEHVKVYATVDRQSDVTIWKLNYQKPDDSNDQVKLKVFSEDPQVFHYRMVDDMAEEELFISQQAQEPLIKDDEDWFWEPGLTDQGTFTIVVPDEKNQVKIELQMVQNTEECLELFSESAKGPHVLSIEEDRLVLLSKETAEEPGESASKQKTETIETTDPSTKEVSVQGSQKIKLTEKDVYEISVQVSGENLNDQLLKIIEVINPQFELVDPQTIKKQGGKVLKQEDGSTKIIWEGKAEDVTNKKSFQVRRDHTFAGGNVVPILNENETGIWLDEEQHILEIADSELSNFYVNVPLSEVSEISTEDLVGQEKLPEEILKDWRMRLENRLEGQSYEIVGEGTITTTGQGYLGEFVLAAKNFSDDPAAKDFADQLSSGEQLMKVKAVHTTYPQENTRNLKLELLLDEEKITDIENWRIWIKDQEFPISTDGRIQLNDLIIGQTYTYRIDPANDVFLKSEGEFEVTAIEDEIITINLDRKPLTNLSLDVVDQNDVPIEGAVFTYDGERFISDQKGKLTVRLNESAESIQLEQVSTPDGYQLSEHRDWEILINRTTVQPTAEWQQADGSQALTIRYHDHIGEIIGRKLIVNQKLTEQIIQLQKQADDPKSVVELEKSNKEANEEIVGFMPETGGRGRQQFIRAALLCLVGVIIVGTYYGYRNRKGAK